MICAMRAVVMWPKRAISKGGHAWAFGSGFGNGRCGSTIAGEASPGAGKRSMAQPPSRRWAGKNREKSHRPW